MNLITRAAVFLKKESNAATIVKAS